LQANNQKSKEIAQFIGVYIRNSWDLHKKLQKIWAGVRTSARARRALEPPLLNPTSHNVSKTKGV